jgi:DNA-binding MurR/RpiR family transcriptional regulator
MSGVSQTTVVRFCHAVGFKGYSDFKLALAADIGAHRSGTVPDEHSDVTRDDSTIDLIRKVLALDMQSIGNTLHTLDPDEFDRAVSALVSANVVTIAGCGGSLAIGMDLHFRLLKSGIYSRMSVDSHIQAVNAGLLGKGGALIAVSYSGETKDILECAELAGDVGATVIAITNFAKSALGKLSDICLAAAATETRWIDDAVAGRMAQLALVDALCVDVSRKRESQVLQVRNRIEKAAAKKRRGS